MGRSTDGGGGMGGPEREWFPPTQTSRPGKFWAVVLVGRGTALEMSCSSHLTQEHLIQMSEAGIYSGAFTVSTDSFGPIHILRNNPMPPVRTELSNTKHLRKAKGI